MTADKVATAAKGLEDVISHLARLADHGDIATQTAHWNRATGLLQDVCDVLGFDLEPRKDTPQ